MALPLLQIDSDDEILTAKVVAKISGDRSVPRRADYGGAAPKYQSCRRLEQPHATDTGVPLEW